MQPKFTLNNSMGLCIRIFALAFIWFASTQVSFSQQRRSAKQPYQDKYAAKLVALVSQQARNAMTNDAGVTSTPSGSIIEIIEPDIVCTTVNGTLQAGDNTFNTRPFRDGVLPAACVNKTGCQPGLSAPGSFYDVISWTNPLSTSQCVTITYTNTAITGGTFTFMTVHQGNYDPTNNCTNWISDIGSSPAVGTPVTITVNLAGSATMNVVVSSVGAITSANYTVVIDAPVCFASPCSGTPNPGNTIATPNPVCPAVNFTLSLQNNTPGSGVSYVWQSSTTLAGPYQTIVGATNSTYTTNTNTPLYYRAQVTCSGNTGTSTPVLVALNSPSSCYCTPPATDCTDDDEILRVQFGSIDNSSTCGTGPPPGYTNYPVTPTTTTDVVKGATMLMTVTMKTVWPEVVSVWIDYNANGAFEASEYSLIGNKPAGTAVISGNVNVPAGATTGLTRMRVRGRFATAWGPGEACVGGGFAETEDYTVNIVPCIPITITQQPANSTIQCSGNTTFSVTATGHFPTYIWEYRPNSSSVWLPVPNTAPFSGVNTNTLTLTNTPSTYNGYQFRVVYAGACTGLDFSNAATLTVGPLVATVSPSSATICTGSIQQLTLTNASSPATACFNSTVNNQGIPDANPVGILNTIAVTGIPAGAIITNVSVTFNLTHTWVGDLDINLIAPNGANMNLVGGLDGGTGSNSTDNFTNTTISSTSTNPISGAPAPRTGIFAAEKRLGYGPTGNTQTVNNIAWTAMQTTMNGNWRLAIADFFSLDVGVLQNWSICITYGAPAQGVWTSNPAAPNTMFTDPAATVPYVAGSLAGTIYVNPTVNTVYTVVYNTATPCTSAPTNIQVNVSNPISALAVAPATRTVCAGGSTTFTATANGGPITWQWQVSTNGGTTWTNISGATASTLTLTNIQQTMQNYRYRVIATAGPCGAVTSTTFGTISTVNPLPTVTVSTADAVITPGTTTTITATSTPAAQTGTSWVWYHNGVIVPGANTNTITVGIDDLGAYKASVVDVNGCEATSANEVVIGADPSDRLWIYPNPTSDGLFQVRLYNSGVPAERRILKVYNTAGVVILEKVFNLDQTSHPYMRMDVDMHRQPAGQYLVQVYDRFGGKVAGGWVVVVR
jgi:subtilisin-like proprotein convertase family protein